MKNRAQAIDHKPALPMGTEQRPSPRRVKKLASRALLFAAAGSLIVGSAALATVGAGEASASSSPTATLTVHESLVILPGALTGRKGWPEFVDSADIDLPANATVDLTIYSFDTGPSPLPKGLPYDKVSGTIKGVETVNGTSVTSVPNATLAHTFTVPDLGLNIAVPAATTAKGGVIDPAVVVASFHLSKKGTFTWQCYAPCGTGQNGMGGPMMTPGYMTGKVVVG